MDKEKLRFKWWELILGAVVAIVVVVIPLAWDVIFPKTEEAPKFAFSSPIFSADESVKVIARNDIAQQEKVLDIEWDNLLFPNRLRPSDKTDNSATWVFTPREITKNNKKLISIGSHKIRLCFSDGHFSDYLKINIEEGKNIVKIGNLMYQNHPFTKEYTWNEAKKYCDDLKLGGYKDWRLPTKNELKELLTKNSIKYYHIRKEFAKNLTGLGWFWTSTPKGSSQAWVVNFGLLRLDNWYNRTHSSYVLCVSGQ